MSFGYQNTRWWLPLSSAPNQNGLICHKERDYGWGRRKNSGEVDYTATAFCLKGISWRRMSSTLESWLLGILIDLCSIWPGDKNSLVSSVLLPSLLDGSGRCIHVTKCEMEEIFSANWFVPMRNLYPRALSLLVCVHIWNQKRGHILFFVVASMWCSLKKRVIFGNDFFYLFNRF